MKVAAIQSPVGSDIGCNVATIFRWIRKARRRKLDLVVFPECCVTGYLPETKTAPPRKDILDEALALIGAAARDARMAVVVGATCPIGRRLFNRSFAFSKSGRIAAIYDKIHLTGPDMRVYEEGKRLDVFRLNGTFCGMQICLDHRYPEGWRVLAAKGAKLLLQPVYMTGRKTRWKTPVIEAHIRSRAAENGVFVVSANIASRLTNHRSMISGPDGILLARAKSGAPQLVEASIQPRLATHEFLNDRRKDLFG